MPISPGFSSTRPTDIRIIAADVFFRQEQPAAAFAFGNAVAGALTLCHVRVQVENRRGEVAEGWGAIFLSHPWAFPGTDLGPDAKDAMMRRTVRAIAARAASAGAFAHPIDHFWSIESEFPTIAARANPAARAEDALPPLAHLVCASAVDAAIHDAFGRVNGISTYDGYDAAHCGHDLRPYLGSAFRGRYSSDYLRPAPAQHVPLAHTVGGQDLLGGHGDAPGAADERQPCTLADWVRREGLRAFKIKLPGQDLDADLERVIAVHRVARKVLGNPKPDVHLSIDFNEQCPSADYLVEWLHRLRHLAPETFSALRYLEQPIPRDRMAALDVSAVSALKPLVVDEALTSVHALRQAQANGWTGVALKTCKCQSLMLALLAEAVANGLLVTVQDLSNPGIALLQSIGLAARVPALSPLEANARQYYSAASAPEAIVHPGVFQVRDGAISTQSISGPGFGYRVEEIDRPIFQSTR